VTRRWLAAVLLAALAGGWLAEGQVASGPAGDALPDFVEVPAGPFIMGADPTRDPLAFDNERWTAAAGEGTVDLPAFLIGRTEVTVGQFAAFAAAGTWTVSPQTLSGPPSHPVTFVTWPGALAYCRWLEATLKQSPVASPVVKQRLAAGWRVRLPSEAQWEKAARGTDGRRFPWGAEPRRDRANFAGSGTTPVGQFPCPECPYGLADMSGNAWEWTASPSQPYPYDPNDDRAHLETDALWVIRGGHFGDEARLVRTTARGAAEPGARRAFIGFRVALVPPAR
jgi:formylglycine-generating enzyme required for sulfatase activity